MLSHHFLVPLDLGDTTQPLLAYATALGAKLKARLTLVHVINVPHFVQPELAAYTDTITKQSKQAMQNHLRHLIAAGIEAETILVHGTPWQAIIDTAKLKAVDLIILSTHGRKGFQHAILGSVAEKVVRLALCPVLVVPVSKTPS